ncbi:MAG: ribbon-helix-helix domain-containing protein [Steroidobacteraceae bacterium]
MASFNALCTIGSCATIGFERSETEGCVPLSSSRRPPSRDKQQIAGHFSHEEAAALKRLAAARETTVRELMARAFNLLLESDRAEHPGEDDPTKGTVFNEEPSARGGAAHRRFVPPPSP